MTRFGLLGSAVLVSLFAGCKAPASANQGAAVPPSDEPARAAGLADDEIAAARKVYIAKCARCHKFYDPAQYDAAEWHSWMKKMSKKARLKADQEQLLTRYLGAFRGRDR